MLNPNGVDESNILDSTNFDALGLNQSLVRALLEAGYTEPTPIQVQAIPKVIEGHDLLGIAQTGTGKTAAFSLPILHHLNAKQSESKARHPRALILAPTRELAIQIADSIKLYGSHIAFKQTSIFGGVGQNPQVAALKRGVDVIVATPGRLLDLVNQGLCHLGHIEYFVLDEADRMLDMGFIHDVKKIVAKLPRKRQTLFFSATMPKSVSALAGELLYKPVNVSVTAQATTVDRIDQSVIFTPQNHKLLQLVNLLSHDSVTSAIVFTRTKHRANRVSLALNKAGISSEPIHGNKSQGARQRALGAFKAGDIKALVATDIAARGIDVDAVSHVINFELPNVSEDYVHRIGRTARAGASGNAISLCAPDERAYLKSIEKLIKLSISVVKGIEVRDEDVPLPEPRGPRPPRRSNRPGGGRGFRGAKLSGEKGGRRKSDGQKQKPASAVGQKKRPAGSGNAGGRRRSQVPKTA
ncbi:MAG: ATP-dependent RNA helicase RhlE [Alphaproteobacteria bacterium UBA4588]|nr:MAG: ATP-dependent RNA helicase RhlE [Alphaproteobacteria bacterium UBA4588]